MSRNSLSRFVCGVGISLCFLTNTSMNANAQSAASAASSPAQVRKAMRKEAREQNRAELKKLEANGYVPNGEQAQYPQNLQQAEHGPNQQTGAANGGRPASAGTSAP